MKPFLKTRYAKIACAALAGVVTLTAAVFANYENANGYNVCKNAIKNIAFQDNCTIDMSLELSLDGEKISSLDNVFCYAEGGNPYYQYSREKTETRKADGTYENYQCESYRGEKFTLDIYNNEGTLNAYQNEYDESSYTPPRAGILNPDDATTQKLVTFVEKIADTMVGDLKNNLIMTESNDSGSTYELTLSGTQMPDWVSSGLSLLVSNIKDSTERTRLNMQEHPEYYDGYEAGADEILYDAMFTGADPVLDGISGTMSVDAEGFPVQANGQAVLTGYDRQGAEHNMTISIKFGVSEIGTTTIDDVDLEALPLTTYDKEGVTTMQIPKDASEETVQGIMENAEERASYGQSIIVRNADGTEIVIGDPESGDE